MKSKKVLCGAIILMAIALAGCETAGNNTADNGNQNQPANRANPVNDGTQALPGIRGNQRQADHTQQTQTQSALPVISPEDQGVINAALKAKDSSLCGQISGKDIKVTCENEVNDQNMMDSAIAKSDATICSKIIDISLANACKTKVAEQISLNTVKSKIDAEYIKAAQIFKSGNIADCSSLTDINVRNSCQFNLAISLARANKDVSQCNAVEDQALKKTCIDGYNANPNGKS